MVSRRLSRYLLISGRVCSVRAQNYRSKHLLLDFFQEAGLIEVITLILLRGCDLRVVLEKVARNSLGEEGLVHLSNHDGSQAGPLCRKFVRLNIAIEAVCQILVVDKCVQFDYLLLVLPLLGDPLVLVQLVIHKYLVVLIITLPWPHIAITLVSVLDPIT